MTKEQMIDIVLEELDHEITIPSYQEKRVRMRLAAAFARMEHGQPERRKENE